MSQVGGSAGASEADAPSLWVTARGPLSIGIGFTGCLFAAALARLTGLPIAAGTMLVAAAVGLSARTARLGPALAIGGIGWLFDTGFVAHSGGELHFVAEDLGLLLFLVAVATLAGLVRRPTPARQPPSQHPTTPAAEGNADAPRLPHRATDPAGVHSGTIGGRPAPPRVDP